MDRYEWLKGQILADILVNRKQAVWASRARDVRGLEKYQDRAKYLEGLKQRIAYMEKQTINPGISGA